MRKIVTRLALSALLLALGVSAQAQQPGKIPKIGWLGGRSQGGPGSGGESFAARCVPVAMSRARL